MNASDDRPQWEIAGEGWGWHAAEWATGTEYGNLTLFLDVLDELRVGPDDDYLDVACGSGLALKDASRRGANAAGIDAARSLIEIANERIPKGDIRAGDMCDLPWPDDSFDVVTSFNGIWNVDEALREIRRVLRPGGRFAMSFWGPPEAVDLWKMWIPALIEFSPPEELNEAAKLNSIAEPGHAERALTEAGITPLRRSSSLCSVEFADTETAARMLTSSGPVYAAAEHSGEETVRTRIEELVTPFVSPSGIVRYSNEWTWLTGQG